MQTITGTPKEGLESTQARGGSLGKASLLKGKVALVLRWGNRGSLQDHCKERKGPPQPNAQNTRSI
jgi:hypothetical protein